MSEKNLTTDSEIFLKYICVEGLNGFLKHEIYLREEGITIIHGPNGCGKTTLLDMVMSFYNKDYNNFSKFDFNEFVLIHSDSNKKDRKIKIIKRKYFIKDEKNFEIKNNKSKGSKNILIMRWSKIYLKIK
ncbi:AAA family ATPase [Acinetobacter baumannii]|uniref:AAA family ATPase n=1 Tax=Acinetobacter baumannii TaxID=470 RepID=UPI0023622F02|nr:AAA family ATPase [Acinetobacter baumannii]MDD1362475.1 AAA family ATPase [Acinetobacter baumannii]